MPSIKDETTVKAIASEYCSNGRCKGEALKTIGYSESYSIGSGRGCEVVFSNVLVVAAIKAIDDENVAAFKLDATAVLDRLSKIAGLTPITDDDDIKSITSADQIRGLDLLGKHLKLWDRAGEQLNVEKPADLTEEEEAQAKRAAILITNTRAS